jgi:hypothetical protein
MKKTILLLVLTLASTQTFAMFCPSGFNELDMGSSPDQVIKSCGPPDTKKTVKAPPEEPQEWNFYVKPDPTQSGTLKMSIAFDANQKVINISVNGTSVITTPICGNNVSAGDTTETVKTACGKPAFINKSQPDTGTSTEEKPEIETTTFVYNTSPPVTLTFVDGKLKERK